MEIPAMAAASTRAEDYRNRAIECEKMATATNDPKRKETWLGLATMWQEIASNIDNLSGQALRT